MKEIVQIKELLHNYLSQDERYRDQSEVWLYRFYESPLPYQIAIRMSGTFDQNQFNQRQSIEGEIQVDIIVAPGETDEIRVEDDLLLTDLAEYLSWFSYVDNKNKALTIRPLKSSSVKNANAHQALMSYSFKLIRMKEG